MFYIKSVTILAFLYLFALNQLFADDLNDNKKYDSLRKYTVPSITVSTTNAQDRISPVAFTEIKQSQIEKSYTLNDMPKLLSEMPSIISYSENGNFIGYTNMTMRGFDQRRISVLINGIPQNDPEDHNFYWINVSDLSSSLDNIQIQRGAGSSNYGAAAIGGSILLTTKDFVRDKGINISSGYGWQEFGGNGLESGQYGSKFAISANSGLSDKYAVYGKFARINSFGYREQSYSYMNSYFLGATRFDKNITTQINIYGGSQQDGLAYDGLPKSYIENKNLRIKNYNYWSYDSTGNNVTWTNNRRSQEEEYFSQPQFELLNDIRISDNISIKSAAFLKLGEGYFDYDGTGWTYASSYRLDSIHGYPNAVDPANPLIRAFVSNKYIGWIPRLIIKDESSEIIIGVEYRTNFSEHWGKIRFAENFPENYDPDYKFYSYNGIRNIGSIFGSYNLSVSKDLNLSLDGQFVWQQYGIENEKSGNLFTQYQSIDGKNISGKDKIFNINYFFLNPRAGVNYNFNDKMSSYLSIAYTLREPRMRNLYAAEDFNAVPLFESKILTDSTIAYDFSKPLVKPEKMLNLEIGWKYSTDDINIGIGGYFMQYADELVSNGQTDVFGVPIDGNAPNTRHIGLELQGSALIYSGHSGNINISGNATFSSNKIIEFDYITETGDKISLKNNDIARFPSDIGNLRLSYDYEGFYISILGKYVGEYRTDSYGDLIKTETKLINSLNAKGEYYYDNTLPAYTIFNADISYKIQSIFDLNSLTIRAQINNLTNVLYAAGAIGRQFFPAAERNVYIGIGLGL
jgi:iron complex outermembrane receptor protein